MKLPIIKIGNSKGLRLSKTLLKQYNIQDKVELIPEKDHLIIKPLAEPRKGWSEAFQQMQENQEDQLLMEDVFEDEDFEEWS
ncbi:MAG: AbrB/MazE/SpoVT family DNA-binding domain-containing protein [Schleiferiaceae bacterium]|jgi:antitoxin MazE|nr:AbrB/MazE/SpoVT family DNA-binding domain-containing protein [Schleiferiaceae bacterium]MDR9442370.1 AbrB/MazE/SpoVT family DNA-binding domain-containing protein [Schleiferiaceae bacterium]